MLRSLVAAGILLATLGLAAAPARTSPGDAKPRLIAYAPDQRIWSIAFTQRYLTWQSGTGDEGAVGVFQRDLRTKRQRKLAAPVHPEYGLASTRGWVVYAAKLHSLIAVRHDGSRRRTLSANLAAPFAGRGERVAWAELDRDTYRVFVRNMATGKQWLAARLPRCVSTRCYRIDGVTLADRGVVFTRGAIGPQPSFIVRRAFTDPAPTSVALPGDPQPELATSSAGALYYWFGRTAGTSAPASLGPPASAPPTRTRFSNSRVGTGSPAGRLAPARKPSRSSAPGIPAPPSPRPFPS
jgi:hypothetical protein